MSLSAFPPEAFPGLLDTISSGVAVYRVENDGRSGSDYRIVYFNRYALEHERKTLEQVVGLSLRDLRPTIDDYGLIEVFRRVWKTGEPGHFPARVYIDEKYSNWYENRVFRLSEEMIVAVYDDVTDLKEAELTLRSYIDGAPYGFFIADGKGSYLDANRAAEFITGYSRQELLSMSIPDLLPEDQIERGFEHFRTVRETGVSNGEVDFLRKDGRRRTWNVSAVRIAEDRFMALCSDVTEQNAVREKLRTNQDRYSLAEKIGRVGSWEYDIATGQFWGSPGARAIYGFDQLAADFSTEEVESCIPERERVHKALVDLIESDAPYDLEFEIVPRGSSDRVTITSVAELIRDGEGDPVKVSGMIRDITSRVRAEKAVRSSEERYRKLFENIRDALIVTDANRRLLSCNTAFLEMFRCTRDEAIGSSVEKFYTSREEFERIGGIIEGIVAGEDNPLISARLRRTDGEAFPGEMNLHPETGPDGEHLGMTGIIRDVTEREELEARVLQSQKMEAIGQLAGGIAHDFNNLLTIINGYSYMLMEGTGPEWAGYRELKEIKNAGYRAAELTRQLLAFSRKQMLKPEVILVNARIRDMESMLRRLIGEHILLETEYSSGNPAVLADPGQFDQIIMNLCVNSRDAMPRGGRLTIATDLVSIKPERAAERDPACSRSMVLIRVTDTGCGIEPEIGEHIFEPFFTTKETGRGTGMGLPTVYGIVKQSGGDVSFESTAESGTVFSILLPLAAGAEEPSSSGPGENARGHIHELILVVEDEAAVRELLTASLESTGFTVLAASGGEEALELLSKTDEPPALVLTDVMMPGMSGRELAEKIRETGGDIPVCFMSGYTTETVEKLGILHGGGYHFIQKPFLRNEIASKLRSILDSRTGKD